MWALNGLASEAPDTIVPGQDPFHAAREIVDDAVGVAYPGCVVEVGRADGILWQEAFGAVSVKTGARAGIDTIYDLASLTKVLATTTLVMRLSESGQLPLDGTVATWLRHWKGDDRSAVTIRDLLAHASGLASYFPFYRDCQGRAEFEAAICELPLEYAPRTQSVYSDLGFILLAFIVADVASVPFHDQFERLCVELGLEELTFGVAAGAEARTAPTGDDPWRGRRLVGEVHDGNAWALGGAAGHAGLFGTVRAVGQFACRVLETLRAAHGLVHGKPGGTLGVASRVVADFARRTSIQGSSRALGWDTMRPTSSCGARMSPTAIGHTGFTGTSLWIDWERNVYAVLLSNRVEMAPPSEGILSVRPAFHDAVVDALDAVTSA